MAALPWPSGLHVLREMPRVRLKADEISCTAAGGCWQACLRRLIGLQVSGVAWNKAVLRLEPTAWPRSFEVMERMGNKHTAPSAVSFNTGAAGLRTAEIFVDFRIFSWIFTDLGLLFGDFLLFFIDSWCGFVGRKAPKRLLSAGLVLLERQGLWTWAFERLAWLWGRRIW